MNIVDYIILGVIGLSILWGFYRGFIQSVLSTAACLLSFIGSFMLYPSLAKWIQGNQSLIMSLFHYTDASSKLSDIEIANASVSTLTNDGITAILNRINLPAPLNSILGYNLENKVFSASNITTVSDYVTETIIAVCVNIISFLACFVVLFIVLSIIINLLRAVFHFPLLKQLDWLIGGLFGALRGLVLCYAVFILVPLFITIAPIDGIQTLINDSTLAHIFNNGNLVLSIMSQRL